MRAYETPFRSPQPPLFPLDDTQWLKALRVAAYAPRRPSGGGSAMQLALFPEELTGALPA